MLLLLGVALALVEYRSRNPEWEAFQKKGIALKIAQLERDANAAQSVEEQKRLKAEAASLKRRTPAIVEVRPFGGKMGVERCLTCHFGIEDLSDSHPNSVFGCVICHGGNGPDLTTAGAHRGLRGGRNPSRLDLAQLTCGSGSAVAGQCHSDRGDTLLNRTVNVPRSLMATNAGIIGVMRFQWGVERDSESAFGVKAVSDGTTKFEAIGPERSPDGTYQLANSHFRKFCASCHLWNAQPRETMGRMQGCAACHAPYADDGRYHGCDPTIDRNEVGHARTHTMTNRIPDERCRACHNRSGRIGLNYHGQMESAQYGTPFVEGGLNDYRLTDGRFVLRLVPDIHHEKGMGCIDCHTGQDAMGDGRVYRFMKDQIEIRCEDCHGSYTEPPRTIRVDRSNRLIRTLMRTSPYFKLSEGDEILVTSKGRPLPNVKKTPKGFKLTSKLTGKEHPVTVITGGKKTHVIPGHAHMECDSCHSAWSPQCYGCHQALDFSHDGTDHITQKKTPGRWVEGRTYFRFGRNILGKNSRGKTGVLVPGCQVWNTVLDREQEVIPPYNSKIMPLENGMTSIAVGSTHPHTTRKEVPRCIDCHFDAKALGLGEGRLTRTKDSVDLQVTHTYDSQAAGLKIDYPLEAVGEPNGDQLQSTSHPKARPFTAKELRAVTAIAPCLPCHDRYDAPAWKRPGPYTLQPACRKALETVE